MDQTDLENLLIGCLTTTTSHKALMKNHINRPGLIKPLEFVLALCHPTRFCLWIDYSRNTSSSVETTRPRRTGHYWTQKVPFTLWGTFVGEPDLVQTFPSNLLVRLPFVAKLNSKWSVAMGKDWKRQEHVCSRAE